MGDERLHQVLSAWAAQPGRAVIFDFNGTLSDDEPILLQVFDEMFREHLGSGLTATEYDDLVGLSDREIVERVLASRGRGGDPLVEDLLQVRAQRYREKVARTSPIRRSTEALVTAFARARVPMAIVTGAQRPDVAFVLERSPVGEHVDVVVTEEDVTNGKPDPEGFHLGARLLGRRPSDVLVFEDSLPGVRAARAARMRCVAVCGRRSPPRLHDLADAAVTALGDVTRHLPLGG